MPGKKPLSPQDVQRSEELLSRMKAPVPATPTEAAAAAAPLNVMRGYGDDVFINGRSFNLAPYTLKSLKAGYALIYKCHALLIAEAMAAREDEALELNTLAKVYNTICQRTGTDEDNQPYTPEEVYSFLNALPETLTPEGLDALYEPILLSIRRHQPEVTREDLEDDFDLAVFVRCLRIIFKLNSGLASSFTNQSNPIPAEA